MVARLAKQISGLNIANVRKSMLLSGKNVQHIAPNILHVLLYLTVKVRSKPFLEYVYTATVIWSRPTFAIFIRTSVWYFFFTVT